MRISDWSSDVCSSDLGQLRIRQHFATLGQFLFGSGQILLRLGVFGLELLEIFVPGADDLAFDIGDVALHPQDFRLADVAAFDEWQVHRSEEHTSELQSLMRISYAVFCLKKKN